MQTAQRAQPLEGLLQSVVLPKILHQCSLQADNCRAERFICLSVALHRFGWHTAALLMMHDEPLQGRPPCRAACRGVVNAPACQRQALLPASQFREPHHHQPRILLFFIRFRSGGTQRCMCARTQMLAERG